MAGNSAPSPLHRLRRVKAALLAVSLILAGILLIMLAAWLNHLNLGTWNWLHSLPLTELGGTLFGAGLLSTLFEYTFRRDQEESTVERFRQTIHDEAPTLRDALIEAFRFDRDDLHRIATPELLDDLARTSLGLRFGDPAFGQEIYADIKHQAIAAEERWYDACVDATLGIPRVRSAAPYSFFDLTVRWKYTVVPKHRFRKFAVVSDRQRYDELVAQRGETSVWYRRPTPGFDVSDPAVFTLEQFTIDGVDVAFQRHADEASQVYVVDIGDEVIRAGKPVVVAFRFRTRTRRAGHVVHIDIDRPTSGLDIEFHYGDAAVAEARMLDFASIGEGGRVEDDRGTQTLRYRYDGWLFPRAGLVFAWTLHNEQVAPLDQAADAQPQANASERTGAGQHAGIAKSSVSAGNDDARPAQAA